MKTISIKDLEKEYANYVQNFIDEGNQLTAETLITLSKSLFDTIKVKGVQVDDGDALLFQHGIYDWEKINNPFFKFDITRQLCKKSGEMYQLSFCLLFNADEFENVEPPFNKWNFGLSINDWENQIKNTKGYESAINYKHVHHSIKMDLI